MNAIGYVRVSTEGQAVDGVSLETQRLRIQAWCDANEYELQRIYEDSGVSGKRADNRPQLQAAIEEAIQHKAALVVFSLSRLARSTKDAIMISERLGKHSADLVSLSERIDTTSAAGKMIFRMLAVLAEFERDQIAERTSAAMQTLKDKGMYTGGRVKYGYEVGEDGMLVENTEEQGVIALARESADCGAGLRETARILGYRGYLSRSGKAFQATQIKQMLMG